MAAEQSYHLPPDVGALNGSENPDKTSAHKDEGIRLFRGIRRGNGSTSTPYRRSIEQLPALIICYRVYPTCPSSIQASTFCSLLTGGHGPRILYGLELMQTPKSNFPCVHNVASIVSAWHIGTRLSGPFIPHGSDGSRINNLNGAPGLKTSVSYGLDSVVASIVDCETTPLLVHDINWKSHRHRKLLGLS